MSIFFCWGGINIFFSSSELKMVSLYIEKLIDCLGVQLFVARQFF